MVFVKVGIFFAVEWNGEAGVGGCCFTVEEEAILENATCAVSETGGGCDDHGGARRENPSC